MPCSTASKSTSDDVAGRRVGIDHPAAAQGPRPLAVRRARSTRRSCRATSPCSPAGSPRSTRSRRWSRRTGTSCSPSSQVAITQASLDLARERLRVTQIGVNGGKTAEAEVPAVLQTIATREERSAQRRARGARTRRSRCAARPACRSAAATSACASPTELETRTRGWKLADLVDSARTARARSSPSSRKQDAERDDRHRGHRERPVAAARRRAPARPEPLGDRLERELLGAAKDLAELKRYRDQRLADVLALDRASTTSGPRDRAAHRAREAARQRDRRPARRSRRRWRARWRSSSSRSGASCSAERRSTLAKQNIQIETDRFNLGRVDELRRAEPARRPPPGRAAQGAGAGRLAQGGDVVHGADRGILPAFGVTRAVVDGGRTTSGSGLPDFGQKQRKKGGRHAG